MTFHLEVGVRNVGQRARRICRLLLAMASISVTAAPWAAESTPSDGAAVNDEAFAVHGQATYTEQEDDGFHAPYSGTNSLSPDIGRETVDATLFVGRRLWHQAELWVNAEVDQGFGLDNTVGVAGFPSGEAYKVGKKRPYVRFPRIFVRQTLDTGTDRESVAPDANQLAGSRSPDRWVFTVGKFAVTDVFDTNQYAHDPRTDFLNWAAVDAGSFDYAADAWGYTVGAAIERYSGPWTLRAGVFDLSDVPNSPHLESGFDEFKWVAELERRYALFGQTGRILVTGLESRGRMGLLDQAVALGQATDAVPDIAAIRSYRGRFGVSVNLEQPLTQNLGIFARLGKATGNVETYEFTDIDRSVEIGASLKGMGWHRAADTVGLVALDEGISAEREQFLNLGGLGILVGDGRLPHPGAEQILETYYNVRVWSAVHVTVDYQWVKNPAYNSDRGPVSVIAVRVHAEF